MIKLTTDQEQAVRKWAQEGSNLSDIQKKLSAQFGISPTYMDVRFMAIDLKLELRERRSEPVKQVAPESVSASPGGSGSEVPPGDEEETAGIPGSVAVELDRVMKPGSVVSGTVRFSDGVKALWFLDQYGRLALDAGQPGYKPVPRDVQAFQQELKKELEARGF